jgi:hypothetical protein
MGIDARRTTNSVCLWHIANEPTPQYFIAKLRAAGSIFPNAVFSLAVYTELRQMSVCWQGILNRVTLFSMGKAKALLVSVNQHFYRYG